MLVTQTEREATRWSWWWTWNDQNSVYVMPAREDRALWKIKSVTICSYLVGHSVTVSICRHALQVSAAKKEKGRLWW